MNGKCHEIFGLVTDYDGVIARDGVPSEAAISALERVCRSGRRVILVTGRLLDGSHAEALGQAEREYLVSLIRQNGGNISQAARQASLSRQGLHKLLKKHGIDARDHRP